MRIVSIILPFDLFVQSVLANTGRWAGAFHPLNGFLLLGLFIWLTHLLWRAKDLAVEGGTATAVADA